LLLKYSRVVSTGHWSLVIG